MVVARPLRVAATNEPAPHTLLSLSQRSRLATAVAAGAGGLLPPPFHSSPAPRRAAGGQCLLLPSCVAVGLHPRCPCLLFRRVAWPHRPEGTRGRRVGKFLWDALPAADYHLRAWLLRNGAGDGIRTRDLLLGKEMLYQLSHSRKPRQQYYQASGRLSSH